MSWGPLLQSKSFGPGADLVSRLTWVSPSLFLLSIALVGVSRPSMELASNIEVDHEWNNEAQAWGVVHLPETRKIAQLFTSQAIGEKKTEEDPKAIWVLHNHILSLAEPAAADACSTWLCCFTRFGSCEKRGKVWKTFFSTARARNILSRQTQTKVHRRLAW